MSFLRAPDVYTESPTEFVRLTSIIQQWSILIIKYIYIKKKLLCIYPITKDYWKKELSLRNIKLILFIYKSYFNDS